MNNANEKANICKKITEIWKKNVTQRKFVELVYLI